MIYLASLSPRRCELLNQIKVNYQQIAVNIAETSLPQETPQDYVSRLALAKARAGCERISTTFEAKVVAPQQLLPRKPVLGADTVVVCDGQLFGKPVDADDAKHKLWQLSGRAHQVMTAVALVTGTIERVRLNISNVYFKKLSKNEIQAYVATGEPLDKAGSYAIQGLASIFIERIEGSYSGVMGLPLYETASLLTETGVKIL